ncbi:MFS transporter [Nocardioides sp. YIM 152588]|uniref:MFS transporter n=1 Tax=Nocardioides sp. YIM 152588 TaxID=3158259 RepID=UPI0032E4E91E
MTDIDKTAAPPAAPDESQGHAHLGWALVLICVAQLMVVLDGTITNIALPYIGQDLGISQANLTWIVTGYALAFGGLLLLGGRLGDLYGRRRIFMIGLTVFAIASLLGGLATGEFMLLGSRALQGVGAAMAAPSALALITTTFPAGPSRNRAFAVYAMMSGVGAAVGLIMGGWLTGMDSVFGISIEGWRLTFLINVPIGLVAAALAPRVLAESETHHGWLDVPGAITGTLGLLGIVFGLSRASEEAYGWGDPQTIAALAGGVVLLAVFAVIESRVEHPLLPIRVLRNRTRATSFLAMMVAPAAMFAMFFYLSLFMQQIVGYKPLHAGFAFLPFAFGMVIGAGASSNLVNRVDPRFLAGTGTLIASFSLFMFSRVSVDDSVQSVLAAAGQNQAVGADLNYWAHIFPWVITMAIGMGLTFVPLTLTAVHHLRREDSGIGSGVLNTMQQVGGALGLATLSTVALHFTNDRAAEITKPISDSVAAGVANGAIPADKADAVAQFAMFQGSFTEGATHAFLVGSIMMLAASAIVWIFLNVKHEELATDGPEGVHVG